MDDNAEIIRGSLSLSDRARVESSHFKPCYFSAILCILAKIVQDADRFHGGILDQVILLADKINQRIGRLRYKEYRTFYNIDILDTNYNIVLKEIIRAEPETVPSDELDKVIETFLEKNQTGILVLGNCAYAFWTADGRYYLFDPYPCDEKGNATEEEGSCCLMRFRELKSVLDKIKENAGETTRKPFRLYIISIAHVEGRRQGKRKQRKSVKSRAKIAEESVHSEETQDAMTLPSLKSESTLIESVEWVTSDPELDSRRDVRCCGFIPIRHYAASMLEIAVLENDITTPTLAPFKEHDHGERTLERMEISDRLFRNHTSVAIPIDLCVMAWSLIHDPASWSERTFRGLFEASVDYAFDSVLASEDTSVSDMTDALLPEFEIGNYAFRAAFAPLHYGTLYATEGWNLAMTLRKIFETRIYTGAIIVCHYAHVGVTRRYGKYFAWWTVTGTKNLRMITSSDMSEFLKLIVREIDAPQETGFIVRAITISYARKFAPDCSDVEGLHEPMAPTISLAKIHRREPDLRDIEAIFKPIEPVSKPIFICGTVALCDRNRLLEPRAKRCYFVALLAVVVKRDIVQSPLPVMIDRILEVAEGLYREFSEPKFHVEHILRNVPLLNRFFDLRDCASSLITLTTNPRTGRNDFFVKVSIKDKGGKKNTQKENPSFSFHS